MRSRDRTQNGERRSRRTAFLPYILRSFACRVKNFCPARRMPLACAAAGLLNAATTSFCSCAESCGRGWRGCRWVLQSKQSGGTRTVYPGDDAHTPPCSPIIAALATLPVPMRLLST